MRVLESTPEARRRNRWMSLLSLVAGGVLLARGGSALPQRPVVELRGDVAQPGFYEVDPTLSAALAAAGADPAGWPAAGLRHGDRVEVGADGLRVTPSVAALALGLPVDVNAASAEGLASLPGLGPKRALAIVEDREKNGPYRDLVALDRVKGIGPSTVEKLGALAVAGPPQSARELSRVPTSR